ncbi:MAG: hypothetical protein U0670_19790 [Anaerolineae bacterium]
MIAAFRVIGRAIRHLNGNGYIYVWANLAFLLFSIPIITMPAAWAGLCKLSYHALRQPNADWDHFIEGFKEWWKRSIPLSLINVVVIAVNGSNLLSYRGDAVGDWALRLVWIAVLVLWFSVQFYAYPLYYAMETPTIRGAVKNAIVMILLNPLFTIGLLIGLLMIWSLSTILAALWGLLTISAMAIIANAAVQDRLRKAGLQPVPPELPPEVSDEIFYGSG